MKKLLEYLKLTASAADLGWKLFTFLVVIGGGTTAGVLAAGSELFRSAGPLAWFGVALAAALCIALIFYLVRASQRASAQATLSAALSSKPHQINPLMNSFEDLIIPIADLQLPGTQLHQHKQFRRCKFVGPGAVALLGGTLVNNHFWDIGHILVIPSKSVLTGITVLRGCTIEQCEFFNTTILIPPDGVPHVAKFPGVMIAGYPPVQPVPANSEAPAGG